jgi:hypothetical protein
MNQHSPPTEQDHLNAAKQYQEYFDNALCEVGVRAPAPTLGQTVNDYRRETDRTIKRTCLPKDHPLYGINYRGLKNDSLDALEPQLLKAAVAERKNPNTVPPGEFREVNQLDPYTGRVVAKTFYGQECFVKQMGRPGRRVVNFMRSVVEPILSRREI